MPQIRPLVRGRHQVNELLADRRHSRTLAEASVGDLAAIVAHHGCSRAPLPLSDAGDLPMVMPRYVTLAVWYRPTEAIRHKGVSIDADRLGIRSRNTKSCDHRDDRQHRQQHQLS